MIRLASAQDAPSVLAIYTPYITDTPVTFEETVPSVAEFTTRIQNTMQKYPWLVCEMEGRIAGYAYATGHRARSSYRWTAEASVYVHPDFRRMKIGSALYTALINLLRLQGIRNVLAGITLPNERSVAFHRSFGFKPVGVYHNIGYKLGAWHDVAWWELQLSDTPGKPDDMLKGMKEIVLRPEWKSILEEGIKKLGI